MRTICVTILAAAVAAISTAAGAAEKVPAVAIHSATTNGVEVRWFVEQKGSDLIATVNYHSK